jgi:Fe-S-cluster containining protein
MGEAKRRRLAERQIEHEVTDPDTGQAYRIRAAGITPRRWLDEWRRFASGQADVPSVPCNGCQQCCWSTRVAVEREEETPEDLAHLEFAEDERGWRLQKRADGACIHLGASGCTVYPHRPRACRHFDCRVFSLVQSEYAIDEEQRHFAPRWIFRFDDAEDKAIMMAAQLGVLPRLGATLRGEAGPLDYEAAVQEIFPGIRENLPKARKLVAKLSELPAAEVEKIIKEGPAEMPEYIRLLLALRTRRDTGSERTDEQK